MGNAQPIVTADAYGSSAKPATNFGNASFIRTGSGYEAFLYFPRPFPLQANIRSATLRLWLHTSVSAGSRTITVQRINKSWAESKLIWKNRPGVTGSSVARSTPVNAKNGMIELDITSLMQAVSDGSASGWYGLRITSGSALNLWSSEASVTAMRPRLVVQWDDQPDAPTTLFPSGGRAVSVPAPVVRCDFTDVSGDVRCAGIHVRLFTSESAATANTAPIWDSGQTATSTPDLDLAAAGWSGTAGGGPITPGTLWWWIVRVKDGSGLWSVWSKPASFTYRALTTVTLTQPSGSTISDPTPEIWWEASGQDAYQVVIRDAATGVRLWGTGWVTDTDNKIEAPAGIITKFGRAYIISVLIWDAYPRESTPNAPTAATASRTVTYSSDGTVTAPSILTATQISNRPTVQLSWTRNEPPDSFVVRRDGDVVAKLDPEDVAISATKYRWTDPAVSGWVPHNYQVSAVTNGKGSNGASTSITLQVGDFWILDPRNEIGPVALFGTNVEWAMGEDSTWHSPVGAAGPVLITQALRGMEGSATDERFDPAMAGTSAEVLAARMLEHRQNPGELVMIVAHRYMFPAVLAHIQVVPIDRPGADAYSVRFQFREDASGPYGVPL